MLEMNIIDTHISNNNPLYSLHSSSINEYNFLIPILDVYENIFTIALGAAWQSTQGNIIVS